MSATRLQEVTELILLVLGDAYVPMGPITLETSFQTDLELESIEFVALAEKLELRYGAEIDFVGWLSRKSLDEIIALRVGDLVALLESKNI